MTIDLSGSNAGLVFDVTAAGAGVEVFQPFVLVSGAQNVTGYSELTDGDTMLRLDIATLTTPIAFTTDLDDTIGQREITISNAEIAGATVTLSTADETITAPFGDNAVARLTPNGCAG
ncbi:MAG: aggregation factor core [Yoonia sp.]